VSAVIVAVGIAATLASAGGLNRARTLASPRLVRGMYFRQAPAGARLPRADAVCARLVTRRSLERRPDNAIANHTVPTGAVQWPLGSGQLHWRGWVANRRRITGRYTGTTDEIIRWGACKWGLDENLVRAAAVQESDWRQSTVGDDCGRAGDASYGILQVKNADCDGGSDIGGYPWTHLSTAFDVDTYAGWLRSCLDGDFYDGSYWLYGGRRVRGDVWGCVGAWYSGDWYSSGARDYIAQVKRHLSAKDWRRLSR
jgi:autotransporter family porin